MSSVYDKWRPLTNEKAKISNLKISQPTMAMLHVDLFEIRNHAVDIISGPPTE
jgi:hypothetical protein